MIGISYLQGFYLWQKVDKCVTSDCGHLLQGISQKMVAGSEILKKGGVDMKETAIIGTIGVVGGIISTLFGGWDSSLTTLVIFMAIDYITGLIVAGVFKKSEKTETGALESRAGFKGLCRKGVTLLIVLVACRLDMAIGTTFVRDATVIAFIANETISIIENAGLMGIPIPKVIVKSIDVLKSKAEEEADVNTSQE